MAWFIQRTGAKSGWCCTIKVILLSSCDIRYMSGTGYKFKYLSRSPPIIQRRTRTTKYHAWIKIFRLKSDFRLFSNSQYHSRDRCKSEEKIFWGGGGRGIWLKLPTIAPECTPWNPWRQRFSGGRTPRPPCKRIYSAKFLCMLAELGVTLSIAHFSDFSDETHFDPWCGSSHSWCKYMYFSFMLIHFRWLPLW